LGLIVVFERHVSRLGCMLAIKIDCEVAYNIPTTHCDTGSVSGLDFLSASFEVLWAVLIKI